MATSISDGQTVTRRGRRRAPKPPFYRRAWFWVTTVLVLLLIAGVAWVAALAPRVFTVQDTLMQALPLATEAKQQLLTGDSEAADKTTQRLAQLSATAREESDATVWRAAEWIPVAGPNLAAVRIASSAVDEMVNEVVKPVAALDLSSLKQPGGINITALQEAAVVVTAAAEATNDIAAEINGINRGGLVSQVDEGVDKLQEATEELQGILEPARIGLEVLPSAIGADGARSYLLLFQNNAESRGTGGNPAAIMRVTFTDGRISIAEQASSADFENGRPDPIVELDAPTLALFDSKIGRYVQDITLTPDFPESSRIAQAFWAESFGTPVDGVISFDPVALSYLLEATGPIQLPTGETMTSENAVALLLNEVYSLYPDPEMQDLFFAGAAGLVFDALVSGQGDMKALLGPMGKALDEGRLLFSPNDSDLAALIAGTRLSGTLPVANDDGTVVSVYVNDTTEGKLDYFMQLDIDASSTQCTTPGSPEFEVSTTLTNTLTPEQAQNLAHYIAPGRFVTKGDVRTDLVVYGPVGASFVSAELSGAAVESRRLVVTEHLGRPAVRVIDVYTEADSSEQLVVRFEGGQTEFGELEVRHTPMVRPSNVTVEAPGCE